MFALKYYKWGCSVSCVRTSRKVCRHTIREVFDVDYGKDMVNGKKKMVVVMLAIPVRACTSKCGVRVSLPTLTQHTVELSCMLLKSVPRIFLQSGSEVIWYLKICYLCRYWKKKNLIKRTEKEVTIVKVHLYILHSPYFKTSFSWQYHIELIQKLAIKFLWIYDFIICRSEDHLFFFAKPVLITWYSSVSLPVIVYNTPAVKRLFWNYRTKLVNYFQIRTCPVSKEINIISLFFGTSTRVDQAQPS